MGHDASCVRTMAGKQIDWRKITRSRWNLALTGLRARSSRPATTAACDTRVICIAEHYLLSPGAAVSGSFPRGLSQCGHAMPLLRLSRSRHSRWVCTSQVGCMLSSEHGDGMSKPLLPYVQGVWAALHVSRLGSKSHTAASSI